MKALYFAWVRERIGCGEEELSPPADVRTVAELVGWLAGRGEGYAHAFENPAVIRSALDHVHARPETPLGSAREVAFFPPMPAAEMAAVSVQAADFDPAAEAALLSAGRADIGAVVTFAGLCRDEAGQLDALEIEHYAGMAEAELTRVAAEAEARWPLAGLRVIHRFGLIRPGERIVFVAAASVHREAAFAASAFLMDYLKTRAPFWKREHRADGTTGAWVAAKDTDAAAADRWARA